MELEIDPMQPSGALLVDKPSGPTSHDIVAFTRRLLKTPRVGHTGTLDPLATGLLVLLVGHATRLAQFLVADQKAYIADVRLGTATPTYDAASLSEVPVPRIEDRGLTSEVRWPTVAELDAMLDRFRGTFLQTPPPYSAKKVAGVRAYESARKNRSVELKPVPVTVRELDVLTAPDPAARTSHLEPDPTLVRLRVVASSGFYVRALAHDLGQALGCGAHLEALRRTVAGRFHVEDAATLDTLQAAGRDAESLLIPLNTLLSDFPAVRLTEEGLRRAANGNALAPEHAQAEDSAIFSQEKGGVSFFRVLGASGEVLAVAERRADGLLHPLLVLR